MMSLCVHIVLSFFSLHDPAPPEIYTLSLHDALPICTAAWPATSKRAPRRAITSTASIPSSAATTSTPALRSPKRVLIDRKSTRLNSSHGYISYAVFCLKKKKKQKKHHKITKYTT